MRWWICEKHRIQIPWKCGKLSEQWPKGARLAGSSPSLNGTRGNSSVKRDLLGFKLWIHLELVRLVNVIGEEQSLDFGPDPAAGVVMWILCIISRYATQNALLCLVFVTLLFSSRENLLQWITLHTSDFLSLWVPRSREILWPEPIPWHDTGERQSDHRLPLKPYPRRFSGFQCVQGVLDIVWF